MKAITFLLIISSCFAADDKPNFSAVIPPLKFGISPIRTIEEHKKNYAEFYELLKVSPFVERLKNASSHGSLPSTLFRPDANGESVDRFIRVLSSVKSASKLADVKLTDIQSIMSDLYDVFFVMESTALVFIPKAIKSVATHIRDQTYETAGMILLGTIDNLNSYVSYLSEFGNFIEGLIRSQKELFLLAASQKDLSLNLQPENLVSKVSQCDFSIERLLVKFQEQLGQAYDLKSLIPDTKNVAEQLLTELLGGKESPKVETPRKRGPLFRTRSKRDVHDKEFSLDAIRGKSEDHATSLVSSPKTPRKKKD